MIYMRIKLVVVVVLAMQLVGCAGASGSGQGGLAGSLGEVASSITGSLGAGTEVSGRSTEASDYSGPRARMAVLRFTDATGGRFNGYRWYSKEVGDSMAKKLTAALLATKRFRMVQRSNVNDLMTEINFGASGAVDASNAAKFGSIVGARLIVTAAITDFEDSGGSRGGAAAGGGGGILGAIGGAKKTYMAINLEVVDVETSEIIASEQIDATVRDVNFAALLGSKGSALGGVAGWDKEPKGKALQKIINTATTYLEESIPDRYYTEDPV